MNNLPLNLTPAQILEAIQNLDASQKSTFFAQSEKDAKEFDTKKKDSVKEIREYLETQFAECIENCRKHIQQQFDSGEWLSNCIDTKETYISVGTNFNPKAESNKKDRKLNLKASFRSHTESQKAEDKQMKDTTKNVKLSSYEKKKAHERATK